MVAMGLAFPVPAISGAEPCTGSHIDLIFPFLSFAPKEADDLDQAVQKVLDDGLRTKDILSKAKKEVSTSQMGDAIISKLK